MEKIHDLVPVYVPQRHLTRVYALIAELDDADDKPGAGDNPWMDPKFFQRVWDESSDALGKIIERLANMPDTWVGIDDLAVAIGPHADRRVVTGTLGAFSRRCRSRYGVDTWPFEYRANKETGLAEYRMSADIAGIAKGVIAR